MGSGESAFCCTSRGKPERVVLRPAKFQCIERGNHLTERAPHFKTHEVKMSIMSPKKMVVGPLWHQGAGITKRLAVASDNEVHVYRVMSDEDVTTGNMPPLVLEHVLHMETGDIVHSIAFSDDNSSRHLVVAQGQESGNKQQLGIWLCDVPESWEVIRGAEVPTPIEWNGEGPMFALQSHFAPVCCLGVNGTFLVSADQKGDCCLWQKNRYVLRAAARLHDGGVVDLVVDRAYVYSAGTVNCTICIWSLPELSHLHSILIDIPDSFLGEALSISDPYFSQKCKISKITRIKRPVSRWAGSTRPRDSSSNQGGPVGILYIAAETATGTFLPFPNAGLILEWNLGTEPECRSITVAHESPIIEFEYGPYDNGPLLTGAADGVFGVWDCVPTINCAQEVLSFRGNGLKLPSDVAMAVDPRMGLYTSVGNSTVSIWRQHAITSNN